MAVDIARNARAKGNHPFGCILVDDENEHAVIKGGNTAVTTGDATCHAEMMNVVRMACHHYTEDFRRNCTLYSSAEPCVMCAGAIYWSGIPRVVYALSEYELKKFAGGATFDLPCRVVFERGTLEVQVEGPFKVTGMREVHEGFWRQEEGHFNGPPPANREERPRKETMPDRFTKAVNKMRLECGFDEVDSGDEGGY